MKRLIFLIFTLCLAPLSLADSALFADIPWGSSTEEAVKQLTDKGFVASTSDKDGDIKFNGALIGYKTTGLAMFSQNRLVKIIVRIITPDNKVFDVYREMKDVLTKKYGRPDSTFEYFRDPYYEGDGFEEQAIRVGKATFSCFWGRDLSLEIHESLTVQLSYESEGWSGESKIRKARATSVF